MVFLREGLCPGLTDEVVQALRAKNIRTVVDLVSSDIEDLAQKCSVSYKTLLAVRRVLLAQNSAFPVTGADLYEELLSSTAILSTGNASLDKLLDSGLYTGELSELVGAPGTGKTQILNCRKYHHTADVFLRCLSTRSPLKDIVAALLHCDFSAYCTEICLGVAVNISCQVKQSVLYIDSTGGLSAKRLQQMIKATISNAEEQMEALRRIQVCPVFDVFSLFECLHHFRSTGLQQSLAGGSSVKAVIVDSVSAVLANMLGGKPTEGMSLMMQVAGELRTLANDLNVAVLVTNHVTRDGNGTIKAGLGQSWSHIPRTRVLLQRIEQPRSTCSSLRTATLIKSSRQPCYGMEEIDLRYWGQCEEKLHGLQGKRKQVSNSPS